MAEPRDSMQEREPEDQGREVIPWLLVGEEVWPDMEGPQVLEVIEAANPHGTAVGRLIVFREEDYVERVPDGWRYVGLLPLKGEGRGIDDAENDGKHQEAPEWSLIPDSQPPEIGRNEEAAPGSVMDILWEQSFEWPECIPCPACPGEAIQGDAIDSGMIWYLCSDCEALVCAEHREQILNAAVLMLLEESVAGDGDPARKSGD